MATASETVLLPQTILPTQWSLADVQAFLGGVPLSRIRSYPPPGMATELDALEIHDREERLCELVDGILVEKVMGSYESLLAGLLIHRLNGHIDQNDRGIVLAPDGALRILPSRMRIPDVSFISWDRFPSRKLPRDRVYRVAPNLAVEIFSEGNTDQEMEIKLDEYRRAGVELIWFIDPESRSATIHRPDGGAERLDENGVLDGGVVLPGFRLALRELLDTYERESK
jgi:Uma2 family endonuclease